MWPTETVAALASGTEETGIGLRDATIAADQEIAQSEATP